ncbi:MAG: hypothetical protein AAF399_23265 [Bacteroidota bacterium]
MRVFCIDIFFNSLHKLRKKPKDGYENVAADICNILQTPALSSTEFVCISDTIQHIQDGNKLILVKTRFPNSAMKEGKRGGFRVITIVNLEEDTITLLEVYPKKGKYGKQDLSIGEYRELLKAYILAIREDSLQEVDPTDDLRLIE